MFDSFTEITNGLSEISGHLDNLEPSIEGANAWSNTIEVEMELDTDEITTEIGLLHGKINDLKSTLPTFYWDVLQEVYEALVKAAQAATDEEPEEAEKATANA